MKFYLKYMQSILEKTFSVEAKRIEVLKKYQILDTPPDGSFDHLTQLAAELLEMPIAIVSLVDGDRIWFKSHHGVDIQEITRDPGLCASAILQDGLYLVENAKKDIRTLANPLVAGEFGLEFYAAVPLKTREGYNLGTFCVIDKKPRKFTQKRKMILQHLGQVVMDQMELRMEARKAIKRTQDILNITAHDLKNPLAMMPLLADMIIHHKENPDAIDNIAKQIKEAGKRMASTIDDLLERASNKEGMSTLHLKEIDFVTLVKKIKNSNSFLAKKKNQNLSLTTENACAVYGDPRKLSEVVDNLINNAIKYSPRGKKIRMVLKVENKNMVLEVIDEGPGLTNDDMKNLFRKFTSLSAKPTGDETSSGMGLSIVKDIIEAHKGKVYAKNKGEGTGAIFVVELPLSEK